MTAKYIIKILTLGDTMVGKSSIVLRFSDDKFDDNIFSTIGIDFKTKYIKYKDSSVKVLIWDTAGQEKFKNIAKLLLILPNIHISKMLILSIQVKN